MKILHTSDWHLGRTLYGHKRYDEFTAFLNWMIETIQNNHIDILLIAGDVFDTSTPSNRSQELYYQFLCKIANSCCRHVVIIGGNHDSPSFLDAPKELLKQLKVYIVGAVTIDPADEVLILRDNANHPQALICAVPYLRDKDLRTAQPGETIDDKNTKLIQGLRQHYADVCAIAEHWQQQFKQEYPDLLIPIIGMGHLFAAGGKIMEGDGVRELYVGSLAHVSASIFPSSIDYLALGHLHIPQRVGGHEHIRYSGSPIPMGYGEATQQKKVVLIEFNGNQRTIEEINLPCFQPLARLKGSLDEITLAIEQLKTAQSRAWLEIEYTGSELIGNLRDLLDHTLEGSSMEIRRIKNKRIMDKIINKIQENETLDDLNIHDVFERCLDANNILTSDRNEMIALYNTVVKSIYEHDVNAE